MSNIIKTITMKYSSDDIRSKYLEFFKLKGHAVIPSAPLVPENDSTVLFNTAGMQALVPYLLGEKHPLGKRLVDSQKCLRTNDIEEVGDNRHLTFFEMLGNWSLGDYFKKESIAWSYEFLTDEAWLNLDPKKLAVTVFEGDENAPRDEESADIWVSVGMPKDRISYLPKKDNWWAAGDTGPCGPDTEIFYWVGEDNYPPSGSNVATDPDNWMEIWNNVFMEYNRLAGGKLVKLPSLNVDTGMGLERVIVTLNGVKSVYDTDIFEGIIMRVVEELGVKYLENTKRSIRIIADHIRAATMLVGDGVMPSNIDQGYILRRLIRRAIRQAYTLGFKGLFLHNVVDAVIDKLGKVYLDLTIKRQDIKNIIMREEKQFSETLERGLKVFDKVVGGMGKDDTIIDGLTAFKLFDTYGFPLEMTEELASEHGLKVDVQGYAEAFAEHQEKSRTATAGKFKGGLADDSGDTVALHSATHLMYEGLRRHIGDHVKQKGANITPERIRFDFSSDEKIEKEILDKVEEFVNNAIASGFSVKLENIPKEEAKARGIEGGFWEKYPDIVSVYTFIGNDGSILSCEICGGPHVTNSGGLGKFKIIKEESGSRGVRRVKAILEK